MFNAILDLFLTRQKIVEPKVYTPRTEKRLVYRYDAAFDDDEPTLEEAFNFYEKQQLCHIVSNGHIKFYAEVEKEFPIGMRLYPKNFFEKI